MDWQQTKRLKVEHDRIHSLSDQESYEFNPLGVFRV